MDHHRGGSVLTMGSVLMTNLASIIAADKAKGSAGGTPTYFSPDEIEVGFRNMDVAWLYQQFVLRGADAKGGPLEVNFTLCEALAGNGVDLLVGDAREAVELILELYTTADTNATTTACQRAINLARNRLRKSWGDSLETRVENPSDKATAFALAMAYVKTALTKLGVEVDTH